MEYEKAIELAKEVISLTSKREFDGADTRAYCIDLAQALLSMHEELEDFQGRTEFYNRQSRNHLAAYEKLQSEVKELQDNLKEAEEIIKKETQTDWHSGCGSDCELRGWLEKISVPRGKG